MKDQRELVRRKETVVSGGSVNYYLVELIDRRTGRVVIVEVEDIIEALEMSFAAGNLFKAVVRIAKLRQDLGKPGSSALYEAQKCDYYAKRMVAQAARRAGNRQRYGISQDEQGANGVITVPDPKRLQPYSFIIGDLVAGLLATDNEANLLVAMLDSCIETRWGFIAEPLRHAQVAETEAAALLKHEKQNAG